MDRFTARNPQVWGSKRTLGEEPRVSVSNNFEFIFSCDVHEKSGSCLPSKASANVAPAPFISGTLGCGILRSSWSWSLRGSANEGTANAANVRAAHTALSSLFHLVHLVKRRQFSDGVDTNGATGTGQKSVRTNVHVVVPLRVPIAEHHRSA